MTLLFTAALSIWRLSPQYATQGHKQLHPFVHAAIHHHTWHPNAVNTSSWCNGCEPIHHFFLVPFVMFYVLSSVQLCPCI